MTWWSCLLNIQILRWSLLHLRLFYTYSSLKSVHNSHHKLIWSCTCYLSVHQWRDCQHWWCWYLLSALQFVWLIETMMKCCLKTCWLIFKDLIDHLPRHCRVLLTRRETRFLEWRFDLEDSQQASFRLDLGHHQRFLLGIHSLSLWWSLKVPSCLVLWKELFLTTSHIRRFQDSKYQRKILHSLNQQLFLERCMLEFRIVLW